MFLTARGQDELANEILQHAKQSYPFTLDKQFHNALSIAVISEFLDGAKFKAYFGWQLLRSIPQIKLVLLPKVDTSISSTSSATSRSVS